MTEEIRCSKCGAYWGKDWLDCKKCGNWGYTIMYDPETEI